MLSRQRSNLPWDSPRESTHDLKRANHDLSNGWQPGPFIEIFANANFAAGSPGIECSRCTDAQKLRPSYELALASAWFVSA